MKESPDVTYRFFGAESVIRRLRALTRLIEGVCEGGDMEYVHKMRVAGRRLRTGMGVLKECLPPDRRKEWRGVVEKVARSLGPVRDLDVQIEFVSDFARTNPDEILQPGLAYFLRQLQTRRVGLQDDVRQAVKRLRKDPMLRELRKHLGKLRRAGRAEFEQRFAGGYSDEARHIAREKILRRLQKFLAYEAWVSDASAGEELHRMRIAAKRLRYAMEIFDPFWRGRLEGFTRRIKEFQQSLGEFHDCDVWIETLPSILEERREVVPGETYERLAPGLQALLEDRRTRREEVYNTFLREYRARQAEGFWESLHETLNQPPAVEPDEPGGAA
ncbi:MAG: CHAD domain-containing protein [Phycisphaerae bacterium]|nr:CHAD domain-containing protein [Phycisphaerae bacterium]